MSCITSDYRRRRISECVFVSLFVCSVNEHAVPVTLLCTALVPQRMKSGVTGGDKGKGKGKKGKLGGERRREGRGKHGSKFDTFFIHVR